MKPFNLAPAVCGFGIGSLLVGVLMHNQAALIFGVAVLVALLIDTYWYNR